jgi:hypothetical protein
MTQFDVVVDRSVGDARMRTHVAPPAIRVTEWLRARARAGAP